jgi:hypothetical protein
MGLKTLRDCGVKIKRLKDIEREPR